MLCKDPFKARDERVERLIASYDACRCSGGPGTRPADPRNSGELLRSPLRLRRRFRRAVVSNRSGRALLEERPGLQRVEVDLGNGAGARVRADAAHRTRRRRRRGRREHDRGGARARHRRLARRALEPRAATSGRSPGPGHIIKGRYTSLQADVGSTEEHWPELADVDSIDGHAGRRGRAAQPAPRGRGRVQAAVVPTPRLAYVMTDGAALPLALSDLVARTAGPRPHRRDDHVRARVRRRLRSGVGAQRARRRAPHRARGRRRRRHGPGRRRHRDAARASPASRSARSSTRPPGCTARRSRACARRSPIPGERHRGVSHHSVTALTVATRSSVLVPFATVGGDEEDDDRARISTTSGIASASRDRRRRAGRHRRRCSTPPACTSSRWAGPRATIRCCSRWPPRPVVCAADRVALRT